MQCGDIKVVWLSIIKKFSKKNFFQGRNINSEKIEFQMGFEPMTFSESDALTTATRDSMASKGEMWVFDWNRITRSHSQMMSWSI